MAERLKLIEAIRPLRDWFAVEQLINVGKAESEAFKSNWDDSRLEQLSEAQLSSFLQQLQTIHADMMERKAKITELLEEYKRENG